MSLMKGRSQPEPSPLNGQRSRGGQQQWPQIPQAPPGGVDHNEPTEPEAPQPRRRLMGHQLLMMVCCVPMLVIVGVLILTGVLGSGAIVYALVCTVMMGAMMFMMPGDKHH